MYAGGTPILILREGTHRKTGKEAQINNIAAARAIADTVRTTLGPKGMDKMLVNSLGDVVITNDGATILKEIEVDHPAAKMIIEIAKTQDEQCGDGTTTAVIFAGELLKMAESLIEKQIHPTLITEGYKIASEMTIGLMEKLAMNTSDDPDALLKIAKTSMNGKYAGAFSELLSEIVVKAVQSIVEERDGMKKADIDNIKIIKKNGGSVEESKLVEGIIIDKERAHEGMSTFVDRPEVMLANVAFEVKKTEIDAKIQITEPSQFKAFLENEENVLRKMVDKVESSGANVLFCQKGINDLAQHFLVKKGIFAVQNVKKSDMEKLAKATGANVILKLEDLSSGDLGKAGTVEEKKIGGEKMIFVAGCNEAKAVSILIRGASEHVLDEIERGMHDALSTVALAIDEKKMTAGGGSVAIEVERELRTFAIKIGGREQFAVEAYANALEVIPRTLAENAGLDPINTIIDINKAHTNKNQFHGVNVFTGKIEDMRSLNVLEPLRVSTQAVRAATETANMILRIDDVIASKGRGGKQPGSKPTDMGEVY